MGAGSKTVTVGYRYKLGLHMIFSAGPVDALLELRGGDRTAWTGNVTSSQLITIDAPDLYGGDEKEGGIVGQVDVMMGEPAQGPNDYLQGIQGNPQPAYRGLFGLVFRRCRLASNNPYLKAVAAKARRIVSGWQGGAPWYPAKAAIDMGGGLLAMNPAHIVYEAMTNPEWGMGYSSGLFNGPNFQAAADTFHAEGLGLCMQWLRQEPIDEFVRIVLDHAGANLVQDRRTGLFELRLIRGGYDPGTLPLFDEDNILQLISFERPAITDAVNEISVQFDDVANGRQGSIAVQNLANVTAQGGVVTQGRNYPGAPTAELATRLAMRDLRAISTPLARARLRVDRSAWNMQPGEVFRLSWPRLGVSQLCMRVLKIDLGTLSEGAIEIEAAEDVFGMPAAAYAAQQPIGWTDPRNPPAEAAVRVVREATFYELQLELGPSGAAAVPEGSGYLVTAAVRPSSDALDYGLQTRTGTAAYQERARGPFAPAGQLAAQLGPGATAASLAGVVSGGLIEAGTYAQIGPEIVRVDSYDEGTGALTIGRGACGTVATTHAAGAWVVFVGDYLTAEGVERLQGDDLEVKILPRTGLGYLASAAAPSDALEIVGAAMRPHPPGRVRINGQTYPGIVATSPVAVSWAHRNRLQQNLEGDESGDIGPEAGTSYALEVRHATTNDLVASYSGGGTSFAAPLVGFYPARITLYSRIGSVSEVQSTSVVSSSSITQQPAAGIPQVVSIQLSGSVSPSAAYTLELNQMAKTSLAQVNGQNVASLVQLVSEFVQALNRPPEFTASQSGAALILQGLPGEPFTFAFYGATKVYGAPYVESVQRHQIDVEVAIPSPAIAPGAQLLVRAAIVAPFSGIAPGTQLLRRASFQAGVADSPAGVVLQIPGEGANNSTSITDVSVHAHPITAAGSARVSTGVPGFPAGSIIMPGSGNYLRVRSYGLLHSSLLALRGISWTIEGFATVGAGENSYMTLLAVQTNDGVIDRPEFSIALGAQNASPSIVMYRLGRLFLPNTIPRPGAPGRGERFHWAVVCDELKMRWFINGRSIIVRADGFVAYDWAYWGNSIGLVGEMLIGDSMNGYFANGSDSGLGHIRISDFARYKGPHDPILSPNTDDGTGYKHRADFTPPSGGFLSP